MDLWWSKLNLEWRHAHSHFWDLPLGAPNYHELRGSVQFVSCVISYYVLTKNLIDWSAVTLLRRALTNYNTKIKRKGKRGERPKTAKMMSGWVLSSAFFKKFSNLVFHVILVAPGVISLKHRIVCWYFTSLFILSSFHRWWRAKCNLSTGQNLFLQIEKLPGIPWKYGLGFITEFSLLLFICLLFIFFFRTGRVYHQNNQSSKTDEMFPQARGLVKN